MSDIWMNLLVSVFVPIIVALISSGKVANRVTRKMKLEDLNGKVNTLSEKVDNISDKIDIVDKKVNAVDEQEKENQALLKRTRILRFNGEIMRGVHHSKEEFDDCIESIDEYERYCENRPDFPNNKCQFAISNVKRVYRECMENNSF